MISNIFKILWHQVLVLLFEDKEKGHVFFVALSIYYMEIGKQSMQTYRKYVLLLILETAAFLMLENVLHK